MRGALIFVTYLYMYQPRTQGILPLTSAKIALALAGQFCNAIGQSYSQINSRVYYSFDKISIQQEATCNFRHENLKLLKSLLQIFGLNMTEFNYICM